MKVGKREVPEKNCKSLKPKTKELTSNTRQKLLPQEPGNRDGNFDGGFL
jgi:hypothetical protein